MVMWIIRQATLRWYTRKNVQYKYWVKGKKRGITSHGNEEEFHVLDLVVMDALGFLSGLGKNLLHSPWLPGMFWVLGAFSERIYLSWWPTNACSYAKGQWGFIQPTVLCWSLTMGTPRWPGPGPCFQRKRPLKVDHLGQVTFYFLVTIKKKTTKNPKKTFSFFAFYIKRMNIINS